ncbi:MAG: hypothetical protein ABI134_03115, partial [Byssovorax sp.]
GVAGAALEEIAEAVVVDDNLLLGPSSADSTRHHTLRMRYWEGSPSTALEEELAREPGSPLCVDLPPTPRGLLSLCRICSLAISSESSVSVVELRPTDTGAPAPANELPRSAFHAGANILRDRPPASSWSKLQVAFAATLWRLWCRRSPVAVSSVLASGHALHPQIASLGLYHSGIFPRLGDQGLLLSRIDELILRQLSRGWVTPAEVYVQAATSAPELDAWLSHTGDEYIAERLHAWFCHTRGRIVERQKAHKSSSSMIGWSYRWHPRGEAILDVVPSLDVAPPVEVGGAVAYDPDRPWVCRVGAIAGPHVSRSPRRSRGQRIFPYRSKFS